MRPRTAGSSPLTRGKHCVQCRAGVCDGLIPAHAGKTSARARELSRVGAHPRSRGENAHPTREPRPGRGSSPLTRGKRYAQISWPVLLRLIPAHAGKTGAIVSKYPSNRAHPRSRGENRHADGAHPATRGSSPLTRGKHWPHRLPGRRGGLIPAHAGKTKKSITQTRACAAHPRSRGENLWCGLGTADTRGSSPLTRGKRKRGPPRRPLSRLIPAHAGKTSRGRSDARDHGAHPRSRGENGTANRVAALILGSSPLTRGKLDRVGAQVYNDGLIPAHAGKTRRPALARSRRRAHPRSRGENRFVPRLFSVGGGSSPLTRGKQRKQTGQARVPGLIPAHAGKTWD